MGDPAARALADAALSVAKRRSKLLDRITAALAEERTEDALRLMRVYCGLDEEVAGQAEEVSK